MRARVRARMCVHVWVYVWCGCMWMCVCACMHMYIASQKGDGKKFQIAEYVNSLPCVVVQRVIKKVKFSKAKRSL